MICVFVDNKDNVLEFHRFALRKKEEHFYSNIDFFNRWHQKNYMDKHFPNYWHVSTKGLV